MVLGVTLVVSAKSLSKSKTTEPTSNIESSEYNQAVAMNAELLTDEMIIKLGKEAVAEEAKRKPSSEGFGSEDQFSDEYVSFRDQFLKVKTGTEFYDLVSAYDAKYDSLPTDLKYTVARIAPWLPLRGIFWRMTPLVHKNLMSQQMLVVTIKNMAEQMEINVPDSHVQAQMLFLSLPVPDLMGKEINDEAGLVTYLSGEVLNSLQKSIKRLESLTKMMWKDSKGKEHAIFYDAKLRFGRNAFNQTGYDDFERFKAIGNGERFAAIARVYRRAYNITFMKSYNWNGYLALREDIGSLFGMGLARATLFDTVSSNNQYLRSVSRQARVNKFKKYPKLLTLNPDGKQWMALSYSNLHKSGLYLEQAWESVQKNNSPLAMLDPDVFTGRSEQIELGLSNIKKLVGSSGRGASGETIITGAISGDEVVVNLKGFFENPPKDLKKLLPTQFNQNEDLKMVSSEKAYSKVKSVKNDIMEVSFPGKGATRFRNYLYGRAVAWDASAEGYGVLFPKLSNGKEVGEAMRILNEARGTRSVTSGITLFIR